MTGLRASLAAAAFLAAALPAAAQQYDHGNPTAAEQLVLEIINRARTDPIAEGARLKLLYPADFPSGDITEGLTPSEAALVMVRPPLAFNSALIAAARAHSSDMYARDYFSHFTLGSGLSPSQRMTAAGYVFNPPSSSGENISSSDPGSPAYVEDILMIDKNYPGRGHRKNLLHIYSSPTFREIGLGYYDFGLGSSKTNVYRHVITQDFARSASSGPYIVGVVYDDLDGDQFYDIGEGLAGVTITPSAGSRWAVSSTSGGFAIPITTNGALTVTASGGPLGGGTLVRNINVATAGENVKCDFTLAAIVTVAATDPNAAEAGLDPGTFTVTRQGNTSGNLTVNYAVTGTAASGADYAALPGSVIVLAGQTTATIPLTPRNDTLVEGNETVIVTLLPGPGTLVGTPGSATVTIADDDAGLPNDADGDGLLDADEALQGTDPNDPDSDNDGLSDGDEILYGYNPLNPDQDANGRVDGLDDWDGDTINNQTEAANGTNPGAAPPPPKKKDDDDKICGSTGLDLLVLLGLLRGFRRRAR